MANPVSLIIDNVLFSLRKSGFTTNDYLRLSRRIDNMIEVKPSTPVRILTVPDTGDYTALFVNDKLIGTTYWPNVGDEELVVREPERVFLALGEALGISFEIQYVTLHAAIVDEVTGIEDEWSYSDIEAHFADLLPHMTLRPTN